MLTDVRQVVEEQVFSDVLKERVGYKWVCSFSVHLDQMTVSLTRVLRLLF